MAASPPSSLPEPKRLKMSSTTASDEDTAEPDVAAAAAAAAAAGGALAEPRRRYKRRKIAIFLAYCGAGYQGMQKNPGARTIEGDLEEALFHAGAVPDPDRGCPKRYDWARSARTDKGVSAAGQVVSGRFYVDPPGLVDRLNAALSPQIRVFGFKRVTASFNCKKFCDRRRYVYLLPVFALDPSAHPNRESVAASLGSGNELARCLECSERGRKIPGVMGRQSGDPMEEDKAEIGGTGEREHCDAPLLNPLAESETQNGKAEMDGSNGCADVPNSQLEKEHEVSAEKVETETLECKPINTMVQKEEEFTVSVSKDVQIEENSVVGDEKADSKVLNSSSEEQMASETSEFHYGVKEKERFSAVLKRFVGTHNFHNLTTRTKAEDPAARRYIISFTADSIVSIEGINFVKCEVVGQSFMLHQIRKMIGLAVAIMRNCAPESLMDTALRKDVNINVPTAPEVGLYLEECLFTSYNQKWMDTHEELSMVSYAEQSEEFKMKHIYSHIAAMEHKEGAVALWLHSLNHRNYPDFLYSESEKNKVNEEKVECVNEEKVECVNTEGTQVDNMAN